MHDLTILALIWVCVFSASFMAHHTRLTPVLWYLFFGSLMVNLGWLPETMPSFIKGLADLGIIIIMFALGFDEDSANFLRSIKRSWGIALFGAITPFLIGWAAAISFWNDNNVALLCGLAMTATAVSLTMVSLKQEGLANSSAATGIMTSAVLDDIASLALVAILVPVTTGNATLSLLGLLSIVGKAAIFFVIVTLLGTWLFPAKSGSLGNIPIIGPFSLRKVLAMAGGEYTVLSLLLLAVLVGLLAEFFGFHPAVGAYMAGLIIKREYFEFHPEKTVDFHRQAQEIINNVAYSWIGPVFFVTLGSKLIFDFDLLTDVLPLSLILFAGLLCGQILSASLAARFTGDYDWQDSWLIGIGMLGRAELAFVVMDIGYVQYHVLSSRVFHTLMLTTFMLNISVPIGIRLWKFYFRQKDTK